MSIEHQKIWYNSLKDIIPNNVVLLLKEPNIEYKEGLHCGTFNEFEDYISAPLSYGKFDIIFIDGRARIECSKFCSMVSHENTLVFIHDFSSRLITDNYKDCLNYLEILDSVGDMSKFKIKNI